MKQRRDFHHRRMAATIAAVTTAIGCLTLTGGARANEPTFVAPLADFSATSDSDGFDSFRSRLGVLPWYANPWSFSGVAMQSTRYSQGNFRKDVAAVLGIYRDQRRDTLAGIDVEAGVARVAGHLRPIGDMTYAFSASPGTLMSLNASADLVETPKALERGTAYTFVSAGLEQRLNERFTVTGLAGWQHFTDGNSRPHLRARLIWLVVPDAGVTLQLRYRQYWSREADVSGGYFNPEDYRQWMSVVAMRKHHAGWIYSGALGAGRENSTGAGSHPAYLAEVRAEGPLGRDARLVLRAAYNRSAGYIDNPDYASRMIGASVVVPFR